MTGSRRAVLLNRPPDSAARTFSAKDKAMQRITITIDDDLMADLDRIIATRGYQNRSEAVRDLARAGIQQAAQDAVEHGQCVGAVVYVYDHSKRDLAKRLVHTFHDHHDVSHATLHVHLDHDSCMEVTVLKGSAPEVRQCANRVIAERGVRHGRAVLIPVNLSQEVHRHGNRPAHRHPHAHIHRAR
jgi:CopG family transcriptional regulator, nickel-responsive regulator